MSYLLFTGRFFIENKQILVDTLYNRYQAALLSRQQVAETLGISIATLDRMKSNSTSINYKRMGKSKNATIKYTLVDVVDYIINNNIKILKG